MRIADLLEKASLSDYVAQYTDLTLVKDEWWGISPLSEKDTDPSFSIRGNMFYDFSAGCGGNVLDFIRKHDHCSFREAVQKLSDWLGVTDEVQLEPLPIVLSMRKWKRRERMRKERPPCELTDEGLAAFRCRSFHFWDDEGLTADVVSKYGVGFDRRNECITIPVRDNNGQLINLLCRTTKEHAKELGIPKYIYRYKLGTLDFFWGWWQNRESIGQKKEVILVEGAKSVMKLASMGYDNAVAILTSHLTEEQMKILARNGFDVVVALDKDINPYNDDVIRGLRRYCRVYIATDRWGLLGEKDSPCDKGAEVWSKIYHEKKLWR